MKKNLSFIAMVISIIALLLSACTKYVDDRQQNPTSTTNIVVWRNQTDRRGGFANIYRNSQLQISVPNTGSTYTNNFGVNNGDVISVTVKASRTEVTPFGVKRKLHSTGVLEYIPGSFQAINGGATGTYLFTIDTLYTYEVIWGSAP